MAFTALTQNSLLQPQIGLPSTWASADPNALFGVLMPYYDQAVRQAFESDNKTFNMFMRKSVIDWSDVAYDFPVEVRRNAGFFASVEGGAILAGDRPEVIRGRVVEKYIGNSISLSDSLVAARNARRALVSLVTYLLKNMVRDTVDGMGRLAFLSGNGVLGRVVNVGNTGATPPGTAAGDHMLVTTNQRLMINQEVEFWDISRTVPRATGFVTKLWPVSSNGVVAPAGTRGDRAAISVSLTRQGTTPGLPAGVTDDATAGIGSGDVMCLRGSQDGAAGPNRVFTGLDAHVDDGTMSDPHENIRRVDSGSNMGFQEWQSTRLSNGGTARDPTTLLLQTLVRAVQTASGREAEVLLANPNLGTAISELLVGNVRYTQGGQLVVGNSGYQVQNNEITSKIQFDVNCPYDKLYALTPSEMAYLEKIPFGWRGLQLDQNLQPVRGSGTFVASQNNFSYNAVWYGVGDTAVFQCTSQGVLEDLTVNVARYGRF